MTTELVPHMGLSASPDVPAEVAEKIRQALINAGAEDSGQIMLSKLKIDNFEAADNTSYDGYAKLLADVFGYLETNQKTAQ